MGKWTRWTPEIAERVIGALAAGADMALAARAAGIARRNIYYRLERDKEFAARVEEARALADDAVQRSLYRAAIGGNTTAQIWWLKNRRPNEWRDRHEVVGNLTFTDIVAEALRRPREKPGP